MYRDHLLTILNKAQHSASCHQKYSRMLTEMYQKSDHRDVFINQMLQILLTSLAFTTDKNVYLSRLLKFMSKFCGEVTQKEEDKEGTHDLLTRVIQKTLEWATLDMYELRYNSCRFISLVLQDIGEKVELEIDLIDEIQRVMLERMSEPKSAICLKAMSAVVRLQDPQNSECPVIKSYLECLSSSSALIRKEAVEHIAPSVMTLSKIKERITDVDPAVRSAAFHRCADFGPFLFKIIDKHTILKCGFLETNERVKTTFETYFLPKWLTAFKGKYLDFIGALKLIANEEDLTVLAYLSKKLMKVFFDKIPAYDLVTVLPVDEDKVIKVEDLSTDITLYWNILVELLRNSPYADEHLSQVLPELTPFCHYIARVMKSKAREQMDEWKYFEYQFDLLNLFEIAENYDLADEVGRRELRSLSMSVLQQYSFTPKLTKKLVLIVHKCTSNIEFFTNDMCQLISDIREPLVDEVLTPDQQRERDFKAAELKVKINILQEQQDEAVSVRDYQKAQLLKNEMIKCKQQLDEFQNGETGKVRGAKSDTETLCRCLDVLIGVLELPAVAKMTPSLITCKNFFLVPLISHQSAEVHWRILRCLVLIAIIDKATALEYARIICIPVGTYRSIPIDNVSALVQSINGVTDLISLYGIEIVSQDEENPSTTSNQNLTKRKLYNNDVVEEDIAIARNDSMSVSTIFDIFLDMLDDERDEIRHKAALAICRLVKQGFTVTPNLISRILLKWFNPLTVKQDTGLQICLGLFIDTCMSFKKSTDTIKEAIIPTLTNIANAPKTSPLADIDVDNVLMFFAQVMNVNLKKDEIRILALDICMKVSENTNDRVVALLTKLLCHLDLQDNRESLTELIDRGEMLLEATRDRVSKKHVEKFLMKLRQQPNSTVNTTERTEDDVLSEITDNNSEENQSTNTSRKEASTLPRSPPKKRRKQSKDCFVRLERLNAEINIENEMKAMQIDDDLHISTPTTDTSDSSIVSTKQRKNRKRRGRNSKSKKDETTLHTIVESSGEIQMMDIDEDVDASSTISNCSEPSQTGNTDNSRRTLRRSSRTR